MKFQPQNDYSGEQFSVDEQRHFHSGLEILENMNMLETSKNYWRVMYNIQVMVFVLWWVGNVRRILLYLN
jgi:hypothetical protein